MNGMLWLAFALFGAAASAFSSFVDKIEVSKVFRNPWVVFVWWGVYWLLASALLLALLPAPLSLNAWAVAAGVVSLAGSVLYFRAINEEDISRVSPILNTSPLFALAFSALLLADALTLRDYAGIAVLVLGAALMGVREPHKLRLGKGAQFALANAAFGGLGAVFTKLATGTGSQMEVMFWIFFCYSLGNLAYGRRHIGEFAAAFARLKPGFLAFLLAMVALVMAANAATIYAYSLGSAPLVAAVGASNPLFVFFYALMASLFAPWLLKEEVIGGRGVAFKLAGGALIIAGVFLIA
jgi:drug/metabolite transporter (DMT)-like permease